MLLGPHGTRYREQTLAATRALDVEPTTRQAVVVTVETFVVGQITFALDEQGSADRSPGRRQQAVREYHQGLIATGEFPQLARVGSPKPTSAVERDRFFTLGLDWLLAGMARAWAVRGSGGQRAARTSVRVVSDQDASIAGRRAPRGTARQRPVPE